MRVAVEGGCQREQHMHKNVTLWKIEGNFQYIRMFTQPSQHVREANEALTHTHGFTLNQRRKKR